MSADLLGPLIVGKSISVDDWVPERPPKKPHLRAAFPPPVPERLPSPDLPPPSPPTVLEDEVFASDEPLPPPPPELHPADWNEKTTSNCQVERGPVAQRQSSQSSSTSQRQLDATNQRHLENSSDKNSDNNNTVHSETSTQRLPENHNSSPQRHYGNIIQRHSENISTSQNSSEGNAPCISHANNMHSVRHNDESGQKLHENSPLQQKYYKNNTSSLGGSESNHNMLRHLENGIPSQRYLERGFSLPRHIEDCTNPQKRLDSITPTQRHSEHNSMSPRHRESFPAQKYVLSASPVQRSVGNEITLQRYQQNGVSQRHHENSNSNQKQLEIGSATQRHVENLKTLDINISVSRHVSNGTLTRRQECGALNNGHLGNTTSYQGQIVTSPAFRNMNDTFVRTSDVKPIESDMCVPPGVPLSRHVDNIRSSLRYPTQKLVVNGKLAIPVSDPGKQSEGPPDLVKMADRVGLRNGDIILPSKSRLQNFSTSISNGGDIVPDDSSKVPRSPPHAKLESDMTGRQKQSDDCGTKCGSHESRVSPLPASGQADGSISAAQHLAKLEHSQELPAAAAVSKLAMHSQQ